MLASDSSLDEYTSKTVKRYSSLFTLPSHAKIILLLCTLCLLGGVLTILPLRPHYHGLTGGLILGASIFFSTLLSDLITYYGGMKSDPIFNFRRCSALSLFSCLIWFGLVFLGSIIATFLNNPDIWIKLFLLGFCAAMILRLLVFFTTSFVDCRRAFIFSLLQPAFCAIPVLFMGSVVGYSLEFSLFLFVSLSIPIVVVTVYLFTFLVDRVGKKTIGIASLSLFKAFMANWTEDVNAPLEGFFEMLSSERSIRLSMLAFKANKKIKAVIVVPNFHPGPFKNVGSSLLPCMIQEALENKLQCVVSVPHGLSGHELDLSSQLQNQKIVERILKSINFSSFESDATSFVQVRKNEANVSCQIFGNCALLTLTLAPKTMEDLPEELDTIIVNEAKKRGLSNAIVIDAHNSIEGPFNLSEAVETLRNAAVTSLEEALNRQHTYLEIGSSKVLPKEFGVRDGMGPGGISVIVTKVGDQKAAYVTIDGNNMICGLREEILSALQEIGIIGGEVLTSDTHVVNGIALTTRGYHPVGEVMDQTKLINYIKQATINALNNLEPAQASKHTETISNVKVIGEKQIVALCLLTEKTAKKAKKLAISIFSIASIVLVTLLTLL